MKLYFTISAKTKSLYFIYNVIIYDVAVSDRQKNSPRPSSLGRKSRTAFANLAIWQFRSQMATELIT